jgi:hypothetical protein
VRGCLSFTLARPVLTDPAMSNLQAFAKWLSDQTEIQQQLDTAARGVPSAQRTEVLSSFAKQHGFDVSVDEAKHLFSALAERELSHAELNKVSGGGVIMGERVAISSGVIMGERTALTGAGYDPQGVIIFGGFDFSSFFGF